MPDKTEAELFIEANPRLAAAWADESVKAKYTAEEIYQKALHINQIIEGYRRLGAYD